MRPWLMIFVVCGFFCLNTWACMSIVIGKNASASHHIMIARNSDSKDATRAKVLKIYRKENGQKIYIGLPYWDLTMDPNYDMPQVTSNQFGVSMSATQTIQSNRNNLMLDPPSHSGKGVSEPNIPAIVMPTATSARHAVNILGKAIETRGVNDGWGFGVLLADAQEAWYLETLSGHQWVAIRIPDDAYFTAANGPGQIQEYDPVHYEYLLSNYNQQTPISFARQSGIAIYTQGKFNFRETYADLQSPTNQYNNYIRLAYAQHALNPTTQEFNEAVIQRGLFPMFLKPEHPISFEDIQKLQSSHYIEYPFYNPYQWSYRDPIPHPFFYPIANPRTSNAHITEVSEPLPNQDFNLSNLQYIALGMPGLNVYLPIYYGIQKVPTKLVGATHKADDYSLFWQFRKIQTLVFLDDPLNQIYFEFEQRKDYVAAHYRELQSNIQRKQQLMEEQYRKTPDTKLIDQFTQEIVDDISAVNHEMITHFLAGLNIMETFHFKNSLELNQWLTAQLRIQDCSYRRYPCDPYHPYPMTLSRDREVDE